VPNAKGNIHAFDLRMMVGAEPAGGFFPVAIYARRARRALPETLVAGASSWDILGTNLSIKARGARAAGSLPDLECRWQDPGGLSGGRQLTAIGRTPWSSWAAAHHRSRL